MRVPDEVRKCVVFVGLPTALPGGQVGPVFKGTAFFVGMPSEVIPQTSYIYLVTAKHVAVALANKPFFVRANTKQGGSTIVSGKGARWWHHPVDSSVDVAVIPWAPPADIDYMHIPTSIFLSDDVIRSKAIGAGDEVFMTGLFAHLSGSSRNVPIVRMGNIAMMSGEPVATKDFGDIEAYLIEARSIGGLSGSPAFVRETIPLGIGMFFLLGLMHGHWDIPPMAKNDEARMDNDEYGQVNMGIAIVIPAKKILEVLNHPELVEARKTQDEQWRKQNKPTLEEQK